MIHNHVERFVNLNNEFLRLNCISNFYEIVIIIIFRVLFVVVVVAIVWYWEKAFSVFPSFSIEMCIISVEKKIGSSKVFSCNVSIFTRYTFIPMWTSTIRCRSELWLSVYCLTIILLFCWLNESDAFRSNWYCKQFLALLNSRKKETVQRRMNNETSWLARQID